MLIKMLINLEGEALSDDKRAVTFMRFRPTLPKHNDIFLMS
jgi:hypothetical protein